MGFSIRESAAYFRKRSLPVIIRRSRTRVYDIFHHSYSYYILVDTNINIILPDHNPGQTPIAL
jgi:hypothetical protein